MDKPSGNHRYNDWEYAVVFEMAARLLETDSQTGEPIVKQSEAIALHQQTYQRFADRGYYPEEFTALVRKAIKDLCAAEAEIQQIHLDD